MKNKNAKVFVGMSGGVDSSVAAALLKKRGFEVVGVHLKCFNVDGCAAGDAEDARRAAEHLDIPFYTFDFEKEYKEKVVEYMINGYKKGITPNPDVMCNQEIKFGIFYKKAIEMKADFVATGHYIRRTGNKLFAAKDKNKDQSYFLWTLKPEQIKYCLFPIGDYKKSRVRALATKFGLHNAAKKDSQGICFLGKVTLQAFLGKYIRSKTGAIINDSGEVVGEHRGAHFYTIGQRHGLGIGGYQKPLYVADKNIKKNTIVVAEGEKNPALYKKEIELANINLPNLIDPPRPIEVFARVRYRQSLKKARFDGKKLIFDRPVKFVANGQSAVIYSKNGLMLGGGVIKSAK